VARFFLLRYLPKKPGMRWMMLSEAVAGGASLEENVATEEGGEAIVTSLVGSSGEAMTDLRPAGKGRFGDKLLDISADGEFIDKGSALKVVRHEGSLVVVEAG
jgi:membrane-bound serine protease (ClpP class)